MDLRLVHFPKKTIENPYLRLFYEALEPHGIHTGDDFILSPRWLLQFREEIDVLHLQWTEWLWKPGREYPPRALLKLSLLLLLAGRLGILRMWTVHNLEPHGGASRVDKIGFRLMARLSDVIICHSEDAAAALRQVYRPKGRIVVMPHGNYVDWYPPPRPRVEVLHEVGLDPSKSVLACVGRIRAYKGLDVACAAAELLGEEVQLLIAGEPDHDFDAAALRSCLRGLPAAAFIGRSLTEQELVDLVSASDLVLLPYRKITGSGALLMAWSLKRAVVASDLPYFREMIPQESLAGWLFEPENPQALAEAIRTGIQTPPLVREAAATEQADVYSWARCVQPVVEAVKEWARSNEGS